MTVNLDSDSAKETNGAPTPDGLQTQNDQQSSGFSAAKLQSTLEALSHKLEEVDARSRALQGDKDRGVTKATKQVEELKAKIAEYEKLKGKGFDTDDALDEITFRDDIRQIKDQLGKFNPASQQATGSSPAGVTEAAKSVFEKAKVDLNSPEAVALLREHGHDMTELTMQVGVLRAKLGQTITTSSSAPAMVGAPVVGEDVSTLLLAFHEVKKFPTSPEYKALKEKLDKRGWK